MQDVYNYNEVAAEAVANVQDVFNGWDISSDDDVREAIRERAYGSHCYYNEAWKFVYSARSWGSVYSDAQDTFNDCGYQPEDIDEHMVIMATLIEEQLMLEAFNENTFIVDTICDTKGQDGYDTLRELFQEEDSKGIDLLEEYFSWFDADNPEEMIEGEVTTNGLVLSVDVQDVDGKLQVVLCATSEW